MEPNGIDYDFDSAEALVITFVVNNHVDDRLNKRAEAWEKAFLEYMQGYTGEYIKVVHSAEVGSYTCTFTLCFKIAKSMYFTRFYMSA